MSNIQERFSDFLISTTTLNASLVPGLNTSATVGPTQVNASLKDVADHVTVTNLVRPNAPIDASHARPSMLASITSFYQNVVKARDAVLSPAPFSSLTNLERQDFFEWLGMIAAVSLNHVFSGTGLDLSVQTIVLHANANQAQRCMLMEMDKDPVYQKAVIRRDPLTLEPIEGRLFYICQKGKAFAIYHPEIGLCAMKDYDASIFDGVLPWHRSQPDSCHSGWLPLLDPASRRSILDDVCLCRISWWTAQNGMPSFAALISQYQSDPGHTAPNNLVLRDSLPNVLDINHIWAGRGSAFGTSILFYQDAAGTPKPMPQLLLKDLMLTSVGDSTQNKLIFNSPSGEKRLTFQGDPELLREFAPVPPLCRTFMQVLDTCQLHDLTFDAKIDANNLISITVTVSIGNSCGEIHSIRQVYDSEHLCQGTLPYLMVWPYIPLPKGLSLWKNFYATWHDQTIGFASILTGSSGKPLHLQQASLTFDFDTGNCTQIHRVTAPHPDWTVCKSSKPIRYAILRDGAADLGVIFMPNYPEYDPHGAMANPVTGLANQITLAIDFGTTSTVCALRTTFLKGGAAMPLPFKDYCRTVTCEDPGAKKALDEERWLGNTTGGPAWSWNKKIFSVAQLFDRTNGTGPNRTQIPDAKRQSYYVDGRLFLASGPAMVSFLLAADGANDPLRTQHIMNDMKFGSSLDTLNRHGASIYLAGLYLHAVLYLLSERIIPTNAPYLELRVSYPNDVTMNGLVMCWSHAKTILDSELDLPLTAPISVLLSEKKHFYSEAIATAAYQKNPNNPLATVPTLVSLDVGGGTTDFSITSVNYPTDVRTLSMRYAGREIIVSSLIEYYRKFKQGAAFNNQKEFVNMWNTSDRILQTQFNSLCNPSNVPITPTFLRGLVTNSSVRMDVELLLSSGLKIDSIATAMQYHLLRQLIAVKFLMLMKVTARLVRNNLNMWINPITKQLNVISNCLEIPLSIGGTTAQMMQYIFDTTMTGLIALQSRPAADGNMERFMAVLDQMFTEELKADLPEGISIQLRIYVDHAVAEKREVCWGMLDPSIDDLSRIAVAAAPAPLTDTARAAAEADAKRLLINYPRDTLNDYLYGTKETPGLLQYLEAYEDIFFAIAPNANLGLGDAINRISDLLKENNSTIGTSFANSRMAVANTRPAYMVEPALAPYQDLLACTYLVEDILDWQIASNQ